MPASTSEARPEGIVLRRGTHALVVVVVTTRSCAAGPMAASRAHPHAGAHLVPTTARSCHAHRETCADAPGPRRPPLPGDGSSCGKSCHRRRAVPPCRVPDVDPESPTQKESTP